MPREMAAFQVGGETNLQSMLRVGTALAVTVGNQVWIKLRTLTWTDVTAIRLDHELRGESPANALNFLPDAFASWLGETIQDFEVASLDLTDERVLQSNMNASRQLPAPTQLAIVDGSPGDLEYPPNRNEDWTQTWGTIKKVATPKIVQLKAGGWQKITQTVIP